MVSADGIRTARYWTAVPGVVAAIPPGLRRSRADRPSALRRCHRRDEMLRCAKTLNLKAKAVTARWEGLAKLPLPAKPATLLSLVLLLGVSLPGMSAFAQTSDQCVGGGITLVAVRNDAREGRHQVGKKKIRFAISSRGRRCCHRNSGSPL